MPALPLHLRSERPRFLGEGGLKRHPGPSSRWGRTRGAPSRRAGVRSLQGSGEAGNRSENRLVDLPPSRALLTPNRPRSP